MIDISGVKRNNLEAQATQLPICLEEGLTVVPAIYGSRARIILARGD